MNKIEYCLDINKFNNVIKEAIVHGGDTGGPYCTNEYDLIGAIKDFINTAFPNAKRSYRIEVKWGIPKVVLDDVPCYIDKHFSEEDQPCK